MGTRRLSHRLWEILTHILTILGFCVVFGYALSNEMTELDMKAEGLTCIDFTTLEPLKNLESIVLEKGDMSYFPDKNCGNPSHQEEVRPLDLPNLRTLILKQSNLVKVPNLSLMPKLEYLGLNRNLLKEIPGTPFLNNNRLKEIRLEANQLTNVPNLTGVCGSLEILPMYGNNLTTPAANHFEGCKIKTISFYNNKVTSLSWLEKFGNMLESINLGDNDISGIVSSDMVERFANINDFGISRNSLIGFDANFCQANYLQSLKIFKNPNLAFFENPFRFCTDKLDKFSSKPEIKMTETNISCDHRRCWMKKFASKLNIDTPDCPDGRLWSSVTEEELCPKDDVGFNVVIGNNGQALFASVLPPARGTVTVASGKVLSRLDCARQCMYESCTYFEFTPGTKECIAKKLA